MLNAEHVLANRCSDFGLSCGASYFLENFVLSVKIIQFDAYTCAYGASGFEMQGKNYNCCSRCQSLSLRLPPLTLRTFQLLIRLSVRLLQQTTNIQVLGYCNKLQIYMGFSCQTSLSMCCFSKSLSFHINDRFCFL